MHLLKLTGKVVLTIGRYRIIHKGHIKYLVNLCKNFDNVIICIGSCYEHGTKKNSILPIFVEKMLRISLAANGIDESRYIILYVSDYPTFDEWLDDIFQLFKKYKVTHFATGNKEDILDVLKEKGYDLNVEFIDPEKESDFPYHASDIRKAMVENNFDLLKEIIPIELQPVIFGSPIFKSVIYANDEKSIHFVPGRQTTDIVVLLKNTLDNDLYVLSGKRSLSKKDFPGIFGLPGGGIDKFETTINAAQRELYEETGLELEIMENYFEPAVVKFKNVNSPKICFLHFIGLYSSIDPQFAGTRGGSSQCFGMLIEDSIENYRRFIESESDLTDVDFYKVTDVFAKGLAYQQNDMLKRAMMVLNAYPLLKEEDQEVKKKTKIINIMGSSNTEKSIMTAEIFSLLKKLSISCEMTGGFAREQYYEGNLSNIINDQLYILGEQNHRIERLIGKVDVIITDSPVSMCAMYSSSGTPIYDAAIHSFNKQDNITFFLEEDQYDETSSTLKNNISNICNLIIVKDISEILPYILEIAKEINPEVSKMNLKINTISVS